MLTRIITGIIGIVVATYIIQIGGLAFGIFSVALAAVAWWEFCGAFSRKGTYLTRFIGILLVGTLCAMGAYGPSAILGVATGSTLLILLLAVLNYNLVNAKEACISVAGIMYFGLSFAHMLMLRLSGADNIIHTNIGDFQLGCALIWVAFIGTWASDTFAYFTGFAFGKHKLCPLISPKKTVEGFIGGLIGTVASVAGLGVFFGFNEIVMGILGFLICIVATLGDLVESVIKRYTGIKDSGNILPGHGGIWDRFDSILYTMPLVYYFVQFVIIK